jgi:hypothetical protein
LASAWGSASPRGTSIGENGRLAGKSLAVERAMVGSRSRDRRAEVRTLPSALALVWRNPASPGNPTDQGKRHHAQWRPFPASQRRVSETVSAPTPNLLSKASSTRLTIKVSSTSSPPGSATSLHMNRTLGYARVSTADQNPDLQVDELTAAGCHRIFVEHATGARAERPQLAQALDHLRSATPSSFGALDRLAVPTGPHRRRHHPRATGRRLPQPPRASRHHQPRRTLDLPPLRRARRVRKGPHPGALPGRGWQLPGLGAATAAGPP